MTDSAPQPACASTSTIDRKAGGLSLAQCVPLRERLIDLAVRTQARLDEADGVGITLLLADALIHVGSNTFTNAVDDVQDQLRQGPCLSARNSGHEVRSDTIGTDETRWPTFTRRAASLGLRSVVSCPLFSAGSTIGSLNLYAKTAAGFATLEPSAAAAVTQTVEEALSSHLLLALGDVVGPWLASTTNDRSDIDRACRDLTDRYHLAPAQARLLLEQIASEDQISEATAARNVLRERR